MPVIETCGSPEVRTEFSYSGNVNTGVTLEFDRKVEIKAEIIQAILNHFHGQTVPAGVSMTEPNPNGVGAFLSQQDTGLTPRHASFLCAILQHESFVDCTLNGKSILVTFP